MADGGKGWGALEAGRRYDSLRRGAYKADGNRGSWNGAHEAEE
jgi:hypothetical protein